MCVSKYLVGFTFGTVISAIVLTVPAMAQQKPSVLSVGKEIYHRQWKFKEAKQWTEDELQTESQKSVNELQGAKGDGLGPMFNARSCAACHERGAGAGVDRNVMLLTVDPRSPLIDKARTADTSDNRKVSVPRISNEGRLAVAKRKFQDLFPPLITPEGFLSLEVVVHEASSRKNYEPIRDGLVKGVPGGLSPKWFDRKQRTSEAIAQQPVVAGRIGDIDYYLSQRNSPPLYGLDLIDQVKPRALREIAKQQALQTEGQVSGRLGQGRFGWRAQTPSLAAFVSGACVGELGLQMPFTKQPPDVADDTYVSVGKDISFKDLHALVSFVRAIPPPKPMVESSPTAGTGQHDVHEGKLLFAKIGCTVCHVETVAPATGIYSDLLLHDMGELLQAASPAPAAHQPSRKAQRSGPRSEVHARQTTVRLPKFAPSVHQVGNFDMMGMGMDMDMGMTGMEEDATNVEMEMMMSGGLMMDEFDFSPYNGGPSLERVPIPYAAKRPLEPRFPYASLPESAANTTNSQASTWDSLQREWRTPPLWGVADSGPYLHDGRATSLDAAIRWHDGESKHAASAYRSLAPNERDKVLAFLKALRAPK